MNNNFNYVRISKNGTAYKPLLHTTPKSNIFNISYLGRPPDLPLEKPVCNS